MKQYNKPVLEIKPVLEHDIQSEIRVAISETGSRSFRINVGVAWTGNKNDIHHNSDGSTTIYNSRPFATFGSVDETKKLKGFSDLFVLTPTIITPEMIGTKIATIAFIEVKSKTGKPSPEQLNFIAQMKSLGAHAGLARSPEDALEIIREE